MTDKVDALIAGAHRDRIAAFRYLAWLDMEQRFLIHELFPDHKRGNVVWFPVDTQVNNLVFDSSPLERAVPVLESFGIDPYADDAWVDFLDINPRDLPIIGPAR